jgi:stress-induced morphogen
VTADQIAAKIREALPDAEVALEDLTGTKDHWKLRVVSAAFAGKSRCSARVINAALAES